MILFAWIGGAAIGLLVLYFIVKAAVRDGIMEARRIAKAAEKGDKNHGT